MKRLIWILCAGFTLAANVDLFAQTGSDYYLPLRVGNYLQYHGGPGLGSSWSARTTWHQIEGTDTINGSAYYREKGIEILDETNETNIFYVFWLRRDILGNVALGAINTTNGSSLLDSATLVQGMMFPNEFLTPGYAQHFAYGGTFNTDSVLSMGESVTVPAGTFNNCLKMREIHSDSNGATVFLEDHWYAQGVGMIKNVRTIPNDESHTDELIIYLADDPPSVAETSIVLKSDSTVFGVALGPGAPSDSLIAILDTVSHTDTMTFIPVDVDPAGTYTYLPTGSPEGTAVINLHPSDGENGYIKVTFTLPAEFSNISLYGRANIDDVGRIFLNGYPLCPPLLSGLPGAITEFGDASFQTSDPSLFKSGTNVILFSDANTGGGPSGAAFYVVINFNPHALGVQPDPFVPYQFLLSQNYPNPFNPSTTIRYAIPVRAHVRLSVFDLLGREVITLVDEVKSAGSYSARFDGSGLTSGVYFYRLQAGQFLEAKRLVLLK